MTLAEWSAIAQIAATVVAAVGIITSLIMSARALREIHRDRVLRHRPHLAFEGGGWRIPIEFVPAGRRVPGIDPKAAAAIFRDIPPDARSVHIADRKDKDDQAKPIFYGQLRNFGPGAAIEVHVTWLAQRVKIGGESFEIDNKKQEEPKYTRGLNLMPTIPQHIRSDSDGQLSRLPTFIDKDIERKIQEAEGILEITCEDVLGNSHIARQRFWLRTGYDASEPYVHITFREAVSEGAV